MPHSSPADPPKSSLRIEVRHAADRIMQGYWIDGFGGVRGYRVQHPVGERLRHLSGVVLPVSISNVCGASPLLAANKATETEKQNDVSLCFGNVRETLSNMPFSNWTKAYDLLG